MTSENRVSRVFGKRLLRQHATALSKIILRHSWLSPQAEDRGKHYTRS
jgi:hypothetical protein